MPTPMEIIEHTAKLLAEVEELESGQLSFDFTEEPDEPLQSV